MFSETERRVIEQAQRLVVKIQAEERRGTPVHPAGHPDCEWTLANGYPAEYVALVEALDELDAIDKSERSRYVTMLMMNDQG